MEAKLDLIRKLNVGRTPVHYIARHLHKKSMPPKLRIKNTELFDVLFTNNLSQQLDSADSFKPTHANLRIRVDEGMSVFRSKTVNKNRDAII